MPGGRRVGQPGHDRALDYLDDRLKKIGLETFAGDTYRLPFSGTTGFGTRMEFTNLVGVVPGSGRSDGTRSKPILIGAHFDSVIDAPCSDDNAAAVAVVLAVAEKAMARPPTSDLIVALFDSEEPPWYLGPDMGSNRFVADHGDELDLAGAFILDLVGHDVTIPSIPFARWLPRIRNFLAVLGAESHPSMAATVERARSGERGLTVLATLNRYAPDLSDHYAFRTAGFPYLFLSCGQGEHYHSPSDTPDWVNYRKVRKVYRYLDSLVRSLDTADPAKWSEDDTIGLEIRTFRRSLGWLYPIILKRLGLDKLETRRDMDALANVLTGTLTVSGPEFLEELEAAETVD